MEQCNILSSSSILLSFMVLLLLCASNNGVVEAGKVTAIIVFGDSSVDAGNNNFIPTLARSNFEPYGRDFEGGKPTGRFCNGRISPDFMSEAFGLKPVVPAYLDPTYSIKDFATGVCFASAGSGYDNATSDVMSVIPLWKEVEYFKEYKEKLISFLGEEKAMETLNEALYVVSIGTNDFLENYFAGPRRSAHFTIDEYQDLLLSIARNFLMDLYILGARKVSVAGLPPMGCLPLERATNLKSKNACKEDYNKLALDFSEKIKNLVTKLRNLLVGFRPVFSNAYDPILEAIQKPEVFGLETVEVGCCGTGIYEMGVLCHADNSLSCTDATKYVFWDAFHGTETLNQIVTDYLLKTSLAEFVGES
ncbi:hypothetical protein C5167_012211 [Papaver somniferum]|uniref:GDSL esterase/lipase n=1 Tax=Papaver somniferum TaxID=3469 RepID=A0A4Y7IXH8_PAPSO|nr:GDSL esterase/lipase At2g42990-like [Papaver somniferum]RZC53357.1 hypothetical protein C5167_012211 [Papaver somniferum]